MGNSYDNALAETIIGFCKAEVICARGPWRTHDAVEYATLESVDWFNDRRLLESICHVPPAEYELEYHRLNEAQAMAAWVNHRSVARGGHGAVAHLGGEERGHPVQVGGDGAPSTGRMRGCTWGEGPCPHSCTTRGQT